MVTQRAERCPARWAAGGFLEGAAARAVTYLVIACASWSVSGGVAAEPSPSRLPASQEPLNEWPFFVEIEPKPQAVGSWRDFVLPPGVFEKARIDLHDLRLYSRAGKEVPYALRVREARSEQQPFPAREFNRTQGPDGSSEVTLEITGEDLEHNEMTIPMGETDYRRRVELEGSDDGTDWRRVHTQSMVQFRRGDRVLRDESLRYSPSRHRFLRLRVYRDPEVDKEPVVIGEVSVLRRVEVPGERWTLAATIGPRLPVRTEGSPGSCWEFTLQADQSPVQEVEVLASDAEFVRNYRLEAGGPGGSEQRMVAVASGVWRRRPDQAPEPLQIAFPATRAARLKLYVTDHRNAPLTLTAVNYTAWARQIVVPIQDDAGPMRLYFGNLEATSPAYDFARNLPERLEPEPNRGVVGQRQENPVYVPEPLALTERWPWLIYAVLSGACLGLAGIAIELSRATIARHDSAMQGAQGPN